MIRMTQDRDCGLVAMSNYLDEVLDIHDAPAAYSMIRREFAYPAGDGFRCDLWDSPPRHFEIMRKVTGRRIALVSDPQTMPCVCLVRNGLFLWHWVTRINANLWHDGHNTRIGPIDIGTIVLAYAVDGDAGDLPWYWGVWEYMTRWA